MKKTTTIALSLILAGGVLYGCTPAPKEPDMFKPRVVAPAKSMSKFATYSESAVPAGKPYILFFYADWCPTCVAWEKSLNEATLPEGAVVLKVNYDEAEELKAQYEITQQSTAVMIDAQGNVVATAADPSMEAVAQFFTDYAVAMEEAVTEEVVETETVMTEEEMVEEPMVTEESSVEDMEVVEEETLTTEESTIDEEVPSYEEMEESSSL